MNNLPLISIITPSLNQGPYLEAALRSVYDQKYANVEHIVVDGGSNDQTLELLEHYSREADWKHLRWISEPDNGQSDALNKGFRMASGEIIGWLNSDDLYRPGCFDQVVSAFQRSPEADIIYGDYACVDEHGNLVELRREISFSKFVLSFHRVLYVSTTAAFLRRRFIDERQLIDTSYHYAMDYEFFLRLAKHRYRFQHVSATLAEFRLQPDSKTIKASRHQLREHQAAVETHIPWTGRGGIYTMLLKTARVGAAVRRYAEKAARGYYFTQFKGAKSTKG